MRNVLRLLAIAVAVFPLPAMAQVRVWQGTLTLPTYEEGSPDPNPPFDQYSTSRFSYPYTLRSNLTDHRAEHAWRAIYLENEYLKCSVLPDIGGHVYTCIDKINGQPIFYANPSIKKANIGYRGAWAAFGIEFNFPVSHNWVSMSPVDFAFAQHADGRASVTVGNVDRVYGMEWMVELMLRPKSTVLEEKVTLSNRSDVRHRFYWWNNAAVQVWDDSRIEYPMRFAASHGFTEVQPWPVNEGKDLSLIRNQTDGAVSLFVHGSREPFMGVWNPYSNSGTAHFADYSELPGKKIWSWGVDADGLDWRNALSDNHSAYVEVQAGLFRNQETYSFLEPRRTIRFSEFWMPVREIGGISRANLSGTVHMAREGNKLTVGFNANQPIPGASIRILKGTQSLLDEKADFLPEHTWQRNLPISDTEAKYSVEIKTANGEVVLHHTEGEYDWTPADEIKVGPQAGYRTPPVDERKEDDWLEIGKEDELDGKLLVAFKTYQDALGKFPQSLALQKSAGRLASALLRYREALEYLLPLTERDTTDAEALYYLGIAYDGLGEAVHARPAYEAAYRSPQFRAAAGLRLGELAARGGDLQHARSYLEESLMNAPGDLRTAEELIAVRSALGDVSASQALAREWLKKFPLSYFLQEQIGTATRAHLADDSARILNVASEYIRLGLYRKALDVLTRDYPTPVPDQSEPGTPPVGKNPMVAYFRGFCQQKLGRDPSNAWGEASKLSTAYIFPSGEIQVAVLQSVLQAYPEDATAHYLLGTLSFSSGMTDSALAEWRSAEKSNPSLPVLEASIGLALLHEKHETEHALEAFRKGAQDDPQNLANYVGMDQTLSLLGRPAEERAEALGKYPKLASAPPEVIYELILSLAEAGDYHRATALFHNRFFARQEGGTNVRQVWFEVQLQRAGALARAGKCSDALAAEKALGSAVPGLAFTQDGFAPMLASARTDYLLAELDAVCHEPAQSQNHLSAAAAKSGPDQIVWAWMAAKKLPNFNQADWEPRLRAAVAAAETRTESSSIASYWLFVKGKLEEALGHRQLAGEASQEALLSPDRMLAYHLVRLEQTPKTSP